MTSLPWKRALAIVAAAAVLAATLASSLGSPTAPVGEPASLLVGYTGEVPSLLFAALGASTKYVDRTLGYAVVETHVPAALEALAGVHPSIDYVEKNGRIQSANVEQQATGWDATRWSASRWDASRWDAARWDAARWDAARWDAARWDAARWDAARWDAARWDGHGSTQDPGFAQQWYLGAIHAPDMWNRTIGYHARTICVIDSGIDYNHPDLAANVKTLPDGYRGYDFVNEDNDPMDDGGHGTHVAGVAAAVMGDGVGVAGVSQAWVIAAKVLDNTGYGTDANLVRGITWCADQPDTHIILMALHTNAPGTTLYNAINYARSKGLLVMAATGNAGQKCGTCVAYPAAYNNVIGVGATNESAMVAGFSNKGARVDLVAPGVNIVGPLPGNQYGVGSGTSQAVAVAAGAAALVWSLDTTKTAEQVIALMKGATKRDDQQTRDDDFGHGRLTMRRVPTA